MRGSSRLSCVACESGFVNPPLLPCQFPSPSRLRPWRGSFAEFRSPPTSFPRLASSDATETVSICFTPFSTIWSRLLFAQQISQRRPAHFRLRRIFAEISWGALSFEGGTFFWPRSLRSITLLAAVQKVLACLKARLRAEKSSAGRGQSWNFRPSITSR